MNYIVASALYGNAPLAKVLDEAKNAGIAVIDVWSKPHGTQREEIDRIGIDKAKALFESRGLTLGVSTRYDLKPGHLSDEIAAVHQLGGKLIVTGAGKPKGDTLQAQARNCVESFRRDAEQAAAHGIALGIENHSNTLLSTPEGIRHFAEAIDIPNLGLAMAPYHLPQDPQVIGGLIRDLGEKIVFFQAWQHGKGCMQKLPKDEELLQMPGRGSLDFRPILAELKRINYQGWTEIFMHPIPRGIPIHEQYEDVTAEINRSRKYLEASLAARAS